MKKVLAAILITLSLTGCSALSTLIPGMGGGTNVAANTQMGKENNQTGVQVGDVKENKVEAQEIGKLVQSEKTSSVDAKEIGKVSQAETAIEAANVSIQNMPPWVVLLIILGWILPSPMEIYRGTIAAITGTIGYIFNGIKELVKLIRGT